MKTLLALVIKPTLEADLCDWLLMHPLVEGFTSQVAFGHGSQHPLTLSEQVVGKRKQVMIWCEIYNEHLDELMDTLVKSYSDAGIHFWQIPINASGIIR